ncbi:MAG: hypothetical protein QNJ14_18815 [Woeseiaceae bacterium]|nr:hypothetical protein [Woeseiaceae bacterium]
MLSSTTWFAIGGILILAAIIQIARGFVRAERSTNRYWGLLLDAFRLDISESELVRQMSSMVRGMMTMTLGSKYVMVNARSTGILLWDLEDQCVLIPWESIKQSVHANSGHTRLTVTVALSNGEQVRLTMPWKKLFDRAIE